MLAESKRREASAIIYVRVVLSVFNVVIETWSSSAPVGLIHGVRSAPGDAPQLQRHACITVHNIG
jgi:hypothetical protein